MDHETQMKEVLHKLAKAADEGKGARFSFSQVMYLQQAQIGMVARLMAMEAKIEALEGVLGADKPVVVAP